MWQEKLALLLLLAVVRKTKQVCCQPLWTFSSPVWGHHNTGPWPGKALPSLRPSCLLQWGTFYTNLCFSKMHRKLLIELDLTQRFLVISVSACWDHQSEWWQEWTALGIRHSSCWGFICHRDLLQQRLKHSGEGKLCVNRACSAAGESKILRFPSW